MEKSNLYRIFDANINRLKEGLRVCEDIARFFLSDQSLSREFKKIRHKISELTETYFSKELLLTSRNVPADIGKNISLGEFKRKNLKDIFFANLQRSKESLRVLEELSKLINKKCALSFKKLRYRIYELEKKNLRKILALSDY